jgi:hypothetical protein
VHSTKIGLSLFILTLLSIPHSAYAVPVESDLDCRTVKEDELTDKLCADINLRTGHACNRVPEPKDCEDCDKLQKLCEEKDLGGDPPGLTAPDPLALGKLGK